MSTTYFVAFMYHYYSITHRVSLWPLQNRWPEIQQTDHISPVSLLLLVFHQRQNQIHKPNVCFLLQHDQNYQVISNL